MANQGNQHIAARTYWSSSLVPPSPNYGQIPDLELTLRTPNPPLTAAEQERRNRRLQEKLERAGWEQAQEEPGQAGGSRAHQDATRSKMIKALIDRPVASVRSDQADGKGKSGFLWSYSDGETVIVCHCCSGFFPGRDFMWHGGCFTQPNPLRGISITVHKPDW